LRIETRQSQTKQTDPKLENSQCLHLTREGQEGEATSKHCVLRSVKDTQAQHPKAAIKRKQSQSQTQAPSTSIKPPLATKPCPKAQSSRRSAASVSLPFHMQMSMNNAQPINQPKSQQTDEQNPLDRKISPKANHPTQKSPLLSASRGS
jgi:hypothetical protein